MKERILVVDGGYFTIRQNVRCEVCSGNRSARWTSGIFHKAGTRETMEQSSGADLEVRWLSEVRVTRVSC